jgi:hypothetical protein
MKFKIGQIYQIKTSCADIVFEVTKRVIKSPSLIVIHYKIIQGVEKSSLRQNFDMGSPWADACVLVPKLKAHLLFGER